MLGSTLGVQTLTSFLAAYSQDGVSSNTRLVLLNSHSRFIAGDRYVQHYRAHSEHNWKWGQDDDADGTQPYFILNKQHTINCSLLSSHQSLTATLLKAN